VPLRALLLRRTALPDGQMIARYLNAPGEVAGVLVGHTHFDHAVDAPALARRYAVEVAVHRPYELGPFVVRFVPSRHSKLLFGRKVPRDGPLTCDHLDRVNPVAYKCGPVYGIRIEVAGISMYHQGSADLDDAELPAEPVDVFLAGVAGRQVTARYWERVLPRLDPRFVVPTHYDNFFSPLGRQRDVVRKVALADVPDESTAWPAAPGSPRCRASTPDQARREFSRRCASRDRVCPKPVAGFQPKGRLSGQRRRASRHPFLPSSARPSPGGTR
jgi:L-ascorbate metabolism protein UlaG (beta-lactamase superfamily)